MLFLQSGQPRIVWNPKTNKTAAEFIKGEFETEDESIQQLLLSLGYEKSNSSERAEVSEVTLAKDVFSTVVGARSRAVDSSPESQRPAVAGTSQETAPSSEKPALGSRKPLKAGSKRVSPPRA